MTLNSFSQIQLTFLLQGFFDTFGSFLFSGAPKQKIGKKGLSKIQLVK